MAQAAAMSATYTGHLNSSLKKLVGCPCASAESCSGRGRAAAAAAAGGGVSEAPAGAAGAGRAGAARARRAIGRATGGGQQTAGSRRRWAAGRAAHDELDEERAVDGVRRGGAVDYGAAQAHVARPAARHLLLRGQLAPAVRVDRLAGVGLAPHRLAAIVHLAAGGAEGEVQGVTARPGGACVWRAGWLAGRLARGGRGGLWPPRRSAGAPTWSVEMWMSSASLPLLCCCCCSAASSLVGTLMALRRAWGVIRRAAPGGCGRRAARRRARRPPGQRFVLLAHARLGDGRAVDHHVDRGRVERLLQALSADKVDLCVAGSM